MRVSLLHGLQDVTLTFNIFNFVLIKNIKSWYYETTYWDEYNKILREYVFLYIQMKIFGQNFLKVWSTKNEVGTILWDGGSTKYIDSLDE